MKGLTRLHTLSLGGPNITDAGLVHLVGFSKLRYLLLYDTSVTAAAVNDLQAALPKCKITAHDKPAPPQAQTITGNAGKLVSGPQAGERVGSLRFDFYGVKCGGAKDRYPVGANLRYY